MPWVILMWSCRAPRWRERVRKKNSRKKVMMTKDERRELLTGERGCCNLGVWLLSSPQLVPNRPISNVGKDPHKHL